MTIVNALRGLVTAKGGESNGKTIVGVLKDLNTALGGEDSGGKTISSVIVDITDAVTESGEETGGK